MFEFFALFLLAVPLHDLYDFHRFPSHAICKDNYQLAESFWLDVQRSQKMFAPFQAGWLDPVLEEAFVCKMFWFAACSVHDWKRVSFYDAKGWSNRMIEIVGRDRYYSGRWLEPVPCWRLPN